MEEQTIDKKGLAVDALNIESSIRSDSTQYNNATMNKQLIHEERNTAFNHAVIIKAIEDGRARDVSFEPKVNGTPAIVCGSGPSLNYSIKFLKDWKGGIFCTTSHALSLIAHDVEPTHIVALDPFCCWDEIKGIDWSKTKTKLIAHPGIDQSLIKNWPNEILLYIENIGRPDSFYATTQKRMYTWLTPNKDDIRCPVFNAYIPTEVTIFACSPPMQLFMAQLLGYGNVFLCGCDFACTEEYERFTNYTVDENSIDNLEDGKINFIAHEHPWEKTESTVYTNNGYPTEPIHLYYKKNMLSAIRLSGQTVFTTDHGAITEIPYVDIEEVINSQIHPIDFPAINYIYNIEKYLASVGAFVVESETGTSFVESANPEVEITGYMQSLFNEYTCPECKIRISASDIRDHYGDECPYCKKGKLQHVNNIDIKKNIKKFVRLLKANGIETNEKDWKPLMRPAPYIGPELAK